MKGNRLLIAILVLSNIALVVVLLTSSMSPKERIHGLKPPKHPGNENVHKNPEDQPEVRAFMRDSIGFKEADIEKFHELRREMGRKGKPFHEQIKQIKGELFTLGLSDTIDIQKRDSLFTEMFESFRFLDSMVVDHFHQLHQLGGEDVDREKLGKFLKEITRKLKPGGPEANKPKP